MTEPVGDNAVIGEAAISPVYKRIERATVLLGAIVIVTAGAVFGWQAALGAALGAITAYINMRWLQRGAHLLVDRMLATGGPAKGALMLAFIGRSGFVLAVAYVIFVSSQPAFYGFVAALFSPTAGAVCEAVYEALPRKDKPDPQTR
jgi:hypothetical protein